MRDELRLDRRLRWTASSFRLAPGDPEHGVWTDQAPAVDGADGGAGVLHVP